MLEHNDVRLAARAGRQPSQCLFDAHPPLVGGQVLKGPTAAFLAWSGFTADAAGVAGFYAGLIDGMVCDERDAGLEVPMLVTDTRLDDPAARRRVAEETLRFAGSLA